MAVDLPLAAPVTTVAVLMEIAVGTVVVAYLLDLFAHVGRGYLASTTLICAAAFGAALLLLPGIVGDSATAHASPESIANLWHTAIGFFIAMLLLALFCGVGTTPALRVIGGVTAVLGIVTIINAGSVLGSNFSSPVLALLGTSAFITGSVVAGMLLGHWYLIAPDLSFRPLRLAVYTIFVAIAAQAVTLLAVLITTPASARATLFSGGNAILFWLLVVGSGIIFSAGVNLLTLHFARTRANQPATAMLYVLIVSVAMAVIPAHLLSFASGVAV